ncbi:(2Fe-2S) ferredoxin domain-containing protein [Anaerobacillus sp. MEB173]|uniref:(2Fe-2S) ferredoxin domain-containing protein n=1 Tax=Anaerobacillus sp. MEB173 TaxID=3383345 RepID=UPI003F93EE2F
MATWDLSTTKHHVLICNGSSCKKAGAEDLTLAIRKEISNQGLDQMIHTTRTLCNGRCQDKCVLITYPDGKWYKNISAEDAPQFIESLMSGHDIESYISHCFNGTGFQALGETVKGTIKDEHIVKKVSKGL